MRAALAGGELRQGAFLVGVFRVVVCRLHVFGVDVAPPRVEYCLPAHFKFHVAGLAYHGGGGKLAVRIEHADEAARHQVVDVALHVGESGGGYARGYDGVVVGHFRRVEHFFRLP